MTFYGGLAIGIMVGVIVGVVTMCLVSASKDTDEITTELYDALEEWVDIDEVCWTLPLNDRGRDLFDRSCKALNKARGDVSVRDD